MTKVLVVDDSALMRRLLSGVLSDAGFQVKIARNGVEGVQCLTEWEPDVVTLDINMPEMDGLTALSLMMEARPTPVVMVSSLTEKGAMATFEALALGAVDYIAKPGGTISLTVDDIAEQLIDKVRAAARARMRKTGGPPPGLQPSIGRATAPAPAPRAPAGPAPGTGAGPGSASGVSTLDRVRATAQTGRHPAADPGSAGRLRQATSGASSRIGGLVLIGVSTGGPRTLEDILPQLPADYPWPILICQHMPPNFTDAFARRMDNLCRLKVREVNTTLPLEPGNVYIGQGGTDLVVVERLGRVVVQPRPETPGHPWHPSVDVMVDSALALLPAEQLIGVQLTGMGNDGAAAMTQLKQRGGRTIAESEDTAVVFGMPAELIERGGASMVLPCHNIARQLCHWMRR